MQAAGRVDLGGTCSYKGRVTSRASARILSDDGSRRQLDLYAVWKRDASSRLRLSVAGLAQRNYLESLAYEGRRSLARATVFRTRPTWRLVWEQSL